MIWQLQSERQTKLPEKYGLSRLLPVDFELPTRPGHGNVLYCEDHPTPAVRQSNRADEDWRTRLLLRTRKKLLWLVYSIAISQVRHRLLTKNNDKHLGFRGAFSISIGGFMSTVKISDGNTKMGKIPSVSLPAIKTFLICQKHKIESKFSNKKADGKGQL